MLTDAQRRTNWPAIWLAVAHVIAIFVGLILWFMLWLMAFGIFTSDWEPGSRAAIPGWLALALSPVIGVVLGWKARVSSQWRSWAPLVAPGILVAVVTAFAISGGFGGWAIFGGPSLWNGMEVRIAVAALYAYGPVVLGFLLRAAADYRLRRSA